MHSTCAASASQIHTGSGVPQYRSREIAQSMLFVEPLAKSSFADRRRMPVDARVARQHRVLERRRAHEPRRARVVQQRRSAAPAVRIRVRDPAGLPQHAAPLELFDQQRVGVLDEQSADDRHRRRELAARADRLQEREVVPLAGRVVVGAERRRHVHDAASIVGRHELFADDDLVVRPVGILEPVERTSVSLTDEIGAAHSADDRPAIVVVLAEHGAHAPVGEDERSLIRSLSCDCVADLRAAPARHTRDRDAPRAPRSTRASTASWSTRECAACSFSRSSAM